MKYTKKPVTVEASQWLRPGDHAAVGIPPFLTDTDLYDKSSPYVAKANTPCRYCGDAMEHHGWVATLEGGHIVCPGDWIITGVAGERYPCKPDVFAATYAPEEPRFPIQTGLTVSWSAAEKAYLTYVRLYGDVQSLHRLAKRGGFGLREFAVLYFIRQRMTYKEPFDGYREADKRLDDTKLAEVLAAADIRAVEPIRASRP